MFAKYVVQLSSLVLLIKFIWVNIEKLNMNVLIVAKNSIMPQVYIIIRKDAILTVKSNHKYATSVEQVSFSLWICADISTGIME